MGNIFQADSSSVTKEKQYQKTCLCSTPKSCPQDRLLFFRPTGSAIGRFAESSAGRRRQDPEGKKQTWS